MTGLDDLIGHEFVGSDDDYDDDENEEKRSDELTEEEQGFMREHGFSDNSNGDDITSNTEAKTNNNSSNTNPKVISVSDASRLHEGKVSVYGIVSTISKLQKCLTDDCSKCTGLYRDTIGLNSEIRCHCKCHQQRFIIMEKLTHTERVGVREEKN